ncbi:MAG: recombination-associated protein RdgC, partial [Syntrophales bacterium LBB04]|nr:recombination-associated protein RdgC [Syntrophales bacterium LBB04]
WTSLENVLDNEFTYAKYKCGPHIIFSLRVDHRTVPPSLLKLKRMEAEQIYLTEKGKKKLYRQEREDIKERVQLELLTKALSVPSFQEICWSPETGSLLFGSLSAKVIEDFEKFFKESFQLVLRPFLPWESIPRDDGRDPKSALSTSSSNESPINSILWGREFLTWLWFKSEERNGMIDVTDKGEHEILFMHRLLLASGDGEYSETVICQGLHSDMKEAREALRQGKKIKEARLQLSKDEVKWEFTFKADQFQFQSLKLPVTLNTDEEEESDREGQNMERIYLLERAIETMDQIFIMFHRLRLSAQWETNEIPRMEKWLRQ